MDLPSLGREGVRYCDKLFRIEERLEKVTPEERLRARQKESLPVVEAFYAWLDTLQPAHKNQKDAITYARNQRKELLRFLDDGRIPISNNAAENAIRPFVVGRKNWLFYKSNDGAVAAADAYSLVETAKANNLDVLKYLNYVFKRVPLADGNLTDEFIDKSGCRYFAISDDEALGKPHLGWETAKRANFKHCHSVVFWLQC